MTSIELMHTEQEQPNFLNMSHIVVNNKKKN